MRRESSKITFLYDIIFIGVLILAGGPAAQAQEWQDDPPVVADWGNFQYITNDNQEALYVGIYGIDSVLHYYADNSTNLWHFRSYDNGVTWSFLRNEREGAVWVSPGPVIGFCDYGKIYMAYDAHAQGDDSFVRFRASTDDGETWAWSRQLRISDYNMRWCNITGNGDTVFVAANRSSSQSDSIVLWRSYNAGQTWQLLGTPGFGGFLHLDLEYDKSKRILHMAYEGPWAGEPRNIYYVRSTNEGTFWEIPVALGEPGFRHSWQPAMESDGRGNVVIVWDDTDGSQGGSNDLYCRVSHDQGITWNPTFRIGDFSALANDVTIKDNHIGVVWYDWIDTVARIAYRESFDGGATWGDIMTISRGFFYWSVGILRTGETIHIAFRQELDHGATAGYVRYDPLTGVWSDIQDLLPAAISLSSHPNPFNSATTISYQGLEGGGSLYIYDIAGRLVRTLDVFAHSGEIAWNVNDDKGNDVSSGVYLARAISSSGNISSPIKLIYLK